METLKEYIERHSIDKEKTSEFTVYLNELLKKHGFEKDSDLYNKANISKQMWSRIINGQSQPSLNTLLKIVFALKLNNHECKYLLKKAGYTLASSSQYALIMRYCLKNKIYDLWKVNEYLEEYDCEIIG